MNFNEVLAEIQAWSRGDRLRLIDEVEAGLDDDHSGELTDELKAMLDRRLATLDANPDDVVSWEDVKARLSRRSSDSNRLQSSPGLG